MSEGRWYAAEVVPNESGRMWIAVARRENESAMFEDTSMRVAIEMRATFIRSSRALPTPPPSPVKGDGE